VPLSADNSPYIKWPLPKPVEPFKINNVLTKKSFLSLKKLLNTSDWGPESDSKYHTMSGRWALNPEIPKEIEQELLLIARDSWNEPDLEQNFIFAVRYQKQGDIVPYLWEHLDDTSSQYMIDLCVEKYNLDNWGLIVENTIFLEEENSAIFFNGQQHIHSRPKYPTESEDAYQIVFFAVYTKPGDWAHNSSSSYTSKEEFIEIAKNYVFDADIRFYEATGHPMIFNDKPVGNTECQDCQECYVTDPKILSKIFK
jgi:hypothetical protein